MTGDRLSYRFVFSKKIRFRPRNEIEFFCIVFLHHDLFYHKIYKFNCHFGDNNNKKVYTLNSTQLFKSYTTYKMCKETVLAIRCKLLQS